MVEPTKSDFHIINYYIVENNQIKLKHDISTYLWESLRGLFGFKDHTSKKCLRHHIISEIQKNREEHEPKKIQAITKQAREVGIIKDRDPSDRSKIDPMEESLKQAIKSIETDVNNVNKVAQILILIDSAQSGGKDAPYNLGKLFFQGDKNLGIKQNISLAVDFYKMAAKNGHAWAQFDLGCCYLDGNGVPKDDKEAFKWFQRAANQLDRYAQNFLGWCYETGTGVRINLTEAVKYYKKSAEQGLPDAQNNLGRCYEKGIGVLKDPAKAFKLYGEAARERNENRHADAMNNVGRCFEIGVGVPPHLPSAFNWYEMGALRGDVVCQYNVGRCYQDGIGVPVDLQKAKEWYQKAADLGNEEALAALKSFPE